MKDTVLCRKDGKMNVVIAVAAVVIILYAAGCTAVKLAELFFEENEGDGKL